MNQHKNLYHYPVISCYTLVGHLVYMFVVLNTCATTMASPTPRPSQITSHKDCRLQLLPQIEGCLLGFIQHYKIYRDTDGQRKEVLLGNLCHSYGETLQCLHLAFLKCSPSDIHLNFMQAKLPNPSLMQRLCFSSAEDDDNEDEQEYNGDVAAVKPSSTMETLKSTTTSQTHYNKHHTDKIETSKRLSTKHKTTTEAVFELGNSLRVLVHDNTKVRETEHRKTKQRPKLVFDKGSDVVMSSTTEKRQNEHQHSFSLKQTQNNVYGSENTPSYGSVAGGATDIMRSLKNDCEGDMQLVNPLCSSKHQSNSSVTNSSCIYNVILSIGLAVLLIKILQEELHA